MIASAVTAVTGTVALSWDRFTSCCQPEEPHHITSQLDSSKPDLNVGATNVMEKLKQVKKQTANTLSETKSNLNDGLTLVADKVTQAKDKVTGNFTDTIDNTVQFLQAKNPFKKYFSEEVAGGHDGEREALADLATRNDLILVNYDYDTYDGHCKKLLTEMGIPKTDEYKTNIQRYNLFTDDKYTDFQKNLAHTMKDDGLMIENTPEAIQAYMVKKAEEGMKDFSNLPREVQRDIFNKVGGRYYLNKHNNKDFNDYLVGAIKEHAKNNAHVSEIAANSQNDDWIYGVLDKLTEHEYGYVLDEVQGNMVANRKLRSLLLQKDDLMAKRLLEEASQAPAAFGSG